MSQKFNSQYGKLVRVEEDPESYRTTAPNNVGLPNLKFWRPGVHAKDTNPETGLETLPSSFEHRNFVSHKSSEDMMRRHVEALRAAKEFGFNMPKEVMNSKFLAALALKEGRPDFGTNQFNVNNDKAIEVYNKLAPRFGNDAATFAASVYDKGEVASRLKIPFPMAWNGTGVWRYDGKTIASGENYAKQFPIFLKAAEHPKNAPLVDFINQHLNSDTYTTPLTKTMQDEVNAAYEKRQSEAYNAAKTKLQESPLRQLQYTFLGSEGMFGVPKEYDPEKMRAAVLAPNPDELRKSAAPEYKKGGAIENTTHYRKMI